jgi:hypothetical protein
MKIFNNNIRFLGMKLVKNLLLFAALLAGVILVFSLGSIAGEYFGKLLNLLN